MVRRMLMLAVVLSLTLTVGCSYNGGVSTTGKFMAGGAVIGGAIGGAAGAHGCYGLGNAGEGVLVGALIGSTAGGLVGNIIEENQIKARIAELNSEIDRLKAENAQLRGDLEAARKKIADLEAEIARLKALPKGDGREVEISLGADVLFKSGSARLSDAGKKALDEAAAKLKSQYAGRFIMVEGHTDSDPIKISGWKSNWELGAARALTVLHYLEERGVDPAKMSAATFSKYQPIASNDNASGKAQNRRAVIVVYRNWTAKK